MSLIRVMLAAAAGGVSGCLCVPAGQAGPISLNVRPGLWEITTSGETAGPPPIPAEALARLTPEQRAKFQAVMAASMARSGTPHVYKSCVTEKSLQRGFDTGDHRAGQKCTQTILSSSASTMDGREECSSERGRASGHFHFEAPDPLTMNGGINLTISDGAHTLTIKRVIQGKWVNADCGKYAQTND